MYLTTRGVRPRALFVTLSLTALLLPLTGCFDGSSSSDDDDGPRSQTGVFIDSAVAGLALRRAE